MNSWFKIKKITVGIKTPFKPIKKHIYKTQITFAIKHTSLICILGCLGQVWKKKTLNQKLNVGLEKKKG